MAEPLRVMLADDSVLVRQGVASVLAAAGMTVVAEAGDAAGLLAAIAREEPDIAVIDIRMPPSFTNEGLEAATTIRERHPDVAVLLLSQHVEVDDAVDLLAAGTGYLLKDSVSDLEAFVDAVRRVAAGGTALDPAVVTELVARRRRHDPLAELTPREREVLALMTEGLTNAGIARRLVVTEGAVEKHAHHIFAKLGLGNDPEAHRRVLAVVRYLES